MAFAKRGGGLVLALALAACTATPGNGPTAQRSSPPAAAASGSPAPKPSQAAPASASPLAQASAAGSLAASGKLFLPLRLSPVLPASLLGNDGAALLANDGGGLIANDGAALLANDGGGLIANDGGGLLGNDGAGQLGNDGAGEVAAGSGNFRLAQAEPAASGASFRYLLSQTWRQSNVLYICDQILHAWAQQKPRTGGWVRMSTPIALLPQVADPRDLSYGQLNAFMKASLANLRFHFATHLTVAPDRIEMHTIALPREGAPLREGYPIFHAQTTKPGELQVVARDLTRMFPLLKQFLIDDLAMRATVQLPQGGQRSIDFTLGLRYGRLTADKLAAQFKGAQLTDGGAGLERARYDWDAQRHFRMAFAEARSQLGNGPTLRYQVVAQTSSLGLAGWIRGWDLLGTPTQKGWHYQDADGKPTEATAPVGIYGDPQGLNLPQPSAELAALLPTDATFQDPSWDLAMPDGSSTPADRPEFTLPAIPAAWMDEAASGP